MFEDFEAYMESQAPFTKEELKIICSKATVRRLRKRQFILQEGEVCRYKIFVCRGLLKTSRMKDDGTEYIMRFTTENTWTTDRESLERQTPSLLNIEALEDTSLVLFTKEAAHELLETMPTFRALSDRLIVNHLDASQERIFMNISYTSEEKYQSFISLYPDLFNRVPLHMVASYLGVSRETLSRIRHAQMKH
jgi:CRP-like cAMP-binding protein